MNSSVSSGKVGWIIVGGIINNKDINEQKHKVLDWGSLKWLGPRYAALFSRRIV